MQTLTAGSAGRLGWRAVLGSGLALGLAASFTCAQVVPGGNLTDLSLEELGALNVSAASKRAQPLFATPAAVTVLLPEDVRRSGYGSVAEAMRLVPGMHVAQLGVADWNIGTRGFNGLSSTKLLVLVDGRTIYSPYYAGVSWSEADLHVSDLARIEVIRGPGATVWGVNAVNGTVNVISRDAHDTQGALLSIRDGSAEGLDVYARSGGLIDDDAAYRVYARRIDTRHSLGPAAPDGEQDFEGSRLGFRFDQHRETESRLTVQGELSIQRILRVNHDPAVAAGVLAVERYLRSFLLTRYERRFAADNRLTMQAYIDVQDGSARGDSQGIGAGVVDDGRNLDLDLTHAVRLGERHDVVWGAGARRAYVDVTPDATLTLQHPRDHYDVFNIFAQDEIALVPDRCRLTLGAKAEHHETNGAAVLPNVRLAWTPSHRQTWWAAASRAVRAPSRSELDTRLVYQSFPGTMTSPPVRVDLVADGTMEEELLDAYELGWRFQPVPAFTIDVSAYRHEYDQLRNLTERMVIQPDPLLVINEFVIVNDLAARGQGVEVSVDWRVSEDWRLTGHYATQTLDAEGGIVLSPLIALDLALPRHLWGVQSWWQFPCDFELIVGASGDSGMSDFGVQGHTRIDAQVIWRPRLDFEWALGIQNALEREHLEYFVGPGFPTAPVRRNVFARFSCRF